jgi:hypothetical protein
MLPLPHTSSITRCLIKYAPGQRYLYLYAARNINAYLYTSTYILFYVERSGFLACCHSELFRNHESYVRFVWLLRWGISPSQYLHTINQTQTQKKIMLRVGVQPTIPVCDQENYLLAQHPLVYISTMLNLLQGGTRSVDGWGAML